MWMTVINMVPVCIPTIRDTDTKYSCDNSEEPTLSQPAFLKPQIKLSALVMNINRIAFGEVL